MSSFLLMLALALPPKPAAWIAALAVGRPDITPALVAVCRRESRCKPLGEHAIDAHMSRTSWGGQVQLGHLDPVCQPYGGGGWATRGAWGLSAASHWRYLPDCYTPEALDIPLVSAFVAARKYLRHCDRVPATSPWCPRLRRGARDFAVARQRS